MNRSLTWFLTLTLLTGSLAAQAQRAGGDAPQFGRWAALAFSWKQFADFRPPLGRAFNEDSEYVAKTMAIRACNQSDCEIKTYVETGCVAYATGWRGNTMWAGFGGSRWSRHYEETNNAAKARARKAAGEAAKVGCDSAMRGEQCSVSEVFCTWDTETGSTSKSSIEEWIYQQGGENSNGLQRVIYQLNVVGGQAVLLNIGLSYDKAVCIRSRRKWARVQQLAEQCDLSIDDLDRLYADAN